MNRWLSFVFRFRNLVVVLLASASFTAFAGDAGWSAGVSGGLTLPAGGSNLRRIGGCALRVGRDVSDSWSVEGEVAWEEDFAALAMQGLWHLNGSETYDYYFGYSRFDPFVTVGARGWIGCGTGQVGPKAGLGAFYHLTDDWALRFDADATLGLETHCEVDFTLAFGVQYSF